ncbi:hypothetical protein Aph01nite_72380 [Acrocarpospora phusangensis]|uniref:Uncharacterized protein n=1 Tax=Acrocarpospora phusangensis TaxID=1070424 RepID=A0A919QHK6_9ACTN|nr:hypothetical protein Aph01nite_72380 [Acrocarpospora phusangensis]
MVERFLAGGVRGDRVPLPGERELQSGTDRGVVFDQKDACHWVIMGQRMYRNRDTGRTGSQRCPEKLAQGPSFGTGVRGAAPPVTRTPAVV